MSIVVTGSLYTLLKTCSGHCLPFFKRSSEYLYITINNSNFSTVDSGNSSRSNSILVLVDKS